MCSAGVRFGFADVVLSQGVALRVDSTYPSLAVVAARDGPKPIGDSPERYAERREEPCEIIASGPDSAAFLSSLYPLGTSIGASEFEAQVPLDAVYLSHRQRNGVSLMAIRDLAQLRTLTNRVVFLGGAYDAGDTFVTAAGEAPGVWVHAAGYQALAHPSRRLDRLAAVLFDLALGLLSGTAFAFGWGRYNQLAREMAESRPPRLGVYLGARFWLVLNIVVLIATVIAVLFMSAWLLQRHLWNNPAGMLVGVFFDAILGSRTHALVPSQDAARHRATTAIWKGNWPRLLDTLALTPVVLYAAWILLVE